MPPVADEEPVYVLDAEAEDVSDLREPITAGSLNLDVQPEVVADFVPSPVPEPVEEVVVDMGEIPESYHTIPSDEDRAVSENELVPEEAMLSSEWGDDVMTEGDLGELLRASAAAIITGESAPTFPDQPVAFSADAQADGDASVLSIDEPDIDMSLADAIKAIDEIEIGDQTEPDVSIVDARDAAVSAREALLAEQEELWASQVHGVAVPVEHAAMETLVAEPDVMSANQVEDFHDLGDVEYVDTLDEPASVASVAAEIPAVAAVAEVPEPYVHLEDVAPLMDDDVRMSDQIEAPDDEAVSVRAEEDSEAVSIAMNEEENDVEEEAAPAPMRPAAVVLPLTRHGRSDATHDARGGVGTMERILRLAAARGAATVYVNAQAAPMVRVDGEFSALEGEPTVSAAVVERLTADVAPQSRDTTAAASEWIVDVPEIGRVRCMAFRDHRGPGLIFRMVPQRAISADSLALPAEVQALCSEADGLVLVAGGRGSGKSTLLTSFVDLINRTRSDHVITAESQIEFLHENKRSFISQREIRGDADAVAAAVRAAAREDPDVLIVEDLRSPDLVSLALDAAQSGRLVFASMPAPSAVSAIERVIEMFPPERREKAQALLAGTLRGVVSQVLLRKLRGGRVAAREVLLNTSTVANLILEGKAFQLPAAIESGRRHGMMPLAESLATLVREGVVHPSHAYRKAPNRDQFLSILRRDGMDTAIAERLA
jgi:twitching motility protein PilT